LAQFAKERPAETGGPKIEHLFSPDQRKEVDMKNPDKDSYRRHWALFKAQLWIILFIHKLLLLWSQMSRLF
jgi:hypothetical protein